MEKATLLVALAVLALLNFLENTATFLQVTVCFTVIIKTFLERRYKEINILLMDNGEILK